MKFGEHKIQLNFYCCFTGKERADEKLIKMREKRKNT